MAKEEKIYERQVYCITEYKQADLGDAVRPNFSVYMNDKKYFTLHRSGPYRGTKGLNRFNKHKEKKY